MVVISPPFTARSPEIVRLPLDAQVFPAVVSDREVTSLTTPLFISIPLIVSSVIVVITPVADTWNAFEVPDVSVPETSRLPVILAVKFG